MFYLVQPYGSGANRTRQATIVSEHPSVEAAYAELDAIADKLGRKGIPGDFVELLVVDEHREPIPRPGAQ